VAGVALVAGLVARPWGLPVLVGVAATCATALVLAAVVVALPARVRTDLGTEPESVDVDGGASVYVRLHNDGPFPLFSPRVVVGVPGGEHAVAAPWLRAGDDERRDFPLRRLRRGVHPLGPVVVQRRDPLGLLAWSTQTVPVQDLYVRPRLVPVPAIGLGLVSDVDGVASDRVSMSDLAFHALREYVSGDDLRHIHWRSSAKADRLLVRQFQDSRRNHLTIVLDSDRAAYASRADYEMAVSVAASLGVRGLQDDLEVTFYSAAERWANCTGSVLLDACCRVERGDWPLSELLGELAAAVASPGLLVLVTGGRPTVDDLRGHLADVGPHARALGVQCETDANPELAAAGSAVLAMVGHADQIGPVMDAYAGSLV